MIELILMQRVEKLGQMGDVVKVRPGYARNFLLPLGKALRANADNMKRFEGERAQLCGVVLQRPARVGVVRIPTGRERRAGHAVTPSSPSTGRTPSRFNERRSALSA
jgi:hypothetical protein